MPPSLASLSVAGWLPAKFEPMPTASLIVLNWRGEQATSRCVASLHRLEGAEECEILVVDNESTAHSRRALAHLEGVKVVPLAENRGFAGGMNAGIAAARGRFVALFNNDLVVGSAWLTQGLQVLEDPAVGIVGGPELPWDGEGAPESQEGGLALVQMDPGRGFTVLGPAPAERKVVAAIDGCNIFARAELLRRLDGFDPDYFAYYEDVDLCARAWALGYKTVFEPGMRVWHRRGHSSDQVARQRAFWSARNQIINIAKHFPETRWRRAAAVVAWEHLLDAIVGHPGGLRNKRTERLSWDRRLGRAQGALWAGSHAGWLSAKRSATIAAGQHDEGFTERLRALNAAQRQRPAGP